MRASFTADIFLLGLLPFEVSPALPLVLLALCGVLNGLLLAFTAEPCGVLVLVIGSPCCCITLSNGVVVGDDLSINDGPPPPALGVTAVGVLKLFLADTRCLAAAALLIPFAAPLLGVFGPLPGELPRLRRPSLAVLVLNKLIDDDVDPRLLERAVLEWVGVLDLPLASVGVVALGVLEPNPAGVGDFGRDGGTHILYDGICWVQTSYEAGAD
jgi:hypothetical protein